MSPMMQELYGPEVAKKVYDRLQELDPELNSIIQNVAYDFFWSRPGLNIRDKSLVTVVSLVILGKEEQTRIHINGFLNAGGRPEEMIRVLVHHSVASNQDAARKGAKALTEVLRARGYSQSQISLLDSLLDEGLQGATTSATWRQESLSSRDNNLVAVSASAAVGSPEACRAAISRFLASGGTRDDIRSIFIHQIVYCGFPAAMNGFAALLDSQAQ